MTFKSFFATVSTITNNIWSFMTRPSELSNIVDKIETLENTTPKHGIYKTLKQLSTGIFHKMNAESIWHLYYLQVQFAKNVWVYTCKHTVYLKFIVKNTWDFCTYPNLLDSLVWRLDQLEKKLNNGASVSTGYKLLSSVPNPLMIEPIKSEERTFYVQCPHCNDNITTSLGYHVHAVYKPDVIMNQPEVYKNKPVQSNKSSTYYRQLIDTGIVWGCGKPFEVVMVKRSTKAIKAEFKE